MKLTQYSDYSLRVLIYLGIHGEELATITEIADSYRISRHHIVKIVHRLGQLGYVETIRGKNGGLRLAQAPERIVIGKVVRDTEPSLNIVECFDDPDACVITPACLLRGALSNALTAFLETLDGYTLADLLKPRRKLQQQLFARLKPASGA